MTNANHRDPADQPRPLRIIAAGTSAVTLILGGLPTVGVPLTPEVTGWLMGVIGALSGLAVALFGERKVTPVASPRDQDGHALTPDTSEATR
ncbi:hypothetical protein CLV71_12335 [Actinophytocola oryzae]|uniref:Uncharacterized protein n=2 Tax=Actinophytocola oryzae TaxID=502181 RepID=A0A4R7UXT2_9PSEU|nr:hypothetical protein CLV71_12335 [Actinophytocola oryzae]